MMHSDHLLHVTAYSEVDIGSSVLHDAQYYVCSSTVLSSMQYSVVCSCMTDVTTTISHAYAV